MILRLTAANLSSRTITPANLLGPRGEQQSRAAGLRPITITVMGARELQLMRKVVMAFPGVTERQSHGAPCFFVSATRPVCYFHDNHRGDGRVSVWCPLPPGVAQELADAEPDRFFRPTPSAGGVFAQWVGLFIEARGGDETDWGEIAALVEEAYRYVAPEYLIGELDGR